VLVAAGVAVAVVLSTRDDSSSTAATMTRPAAVRSVALNGKVVVTECAPVEGTRWSYPGEIEMSSTKYESFATGYDCGEAARWTKELSGRTLRNKRVGVPSLLAGVPGFRCSGYPDKNGRAYAGVCRKGTSAVQFGWNINVLKGPRDQVVNAEDVSRQQLGSADASTILRQVGTKRYQLDVANTSSLGYIERLSWSPPDGFTITAVNGSTGGICKLADGGTIECHGRLRPPKCLCTNSGGVLSITFTANAKAYSIVNGYRVYHAPVGGHLSVSAVDPVPYLVPSTRAGQRHHGNL
jgi:hypothetical protein